MNEPLPFDASLTVFPTCFSQATIPQLGLEVLGKEALNIFESPTEDDLKDLPHPDLQANDITSMVWYNTWVNDPLNQLFHKVVENSQWICHEGLGQMAIAKTNYIKLDKNSQYDLNCSPNTELVGILIVENNPPKDLEDDQNYTTIEMEIEDPALDKKRLTSQIENHRIFGGEEIVYKSLAEVRTVLLLPSFLRCRFFNNTNTNITIYKSDLCFKNRPLNPYVESHLREVEYQERLKKEIDALLDTHFSSLLSPSDVRDLSELEQKTKAREIARMSVEDKYNYYKTDYEINSATQQQVVNFDPANQVDLDTTNTEDE